MAYIFLISNEQNRAKLFYQEFFSVTIDFTLINKTCTW